jgi:hypothetical protein
VLFVIGLLARASAASGLPQASPPVAALKVVVCVEAEGTSSCLHQRANARKLAEDASLIDIQELASRVTNGMRVGGYTVVEDGRAADVRLVVTVPAAEKKCPTGGSQHCYDAAVLVKAIAGYDNGLLAETRQEFSAAAKMTEGHFDQVLRIEIPAQQVEQALNSVLSSQKLPVYYSQLQERERERARTEEAAREEQARQTQAAKEQEARQAQEEQQRLEKADDEAWAASSPGVCRRAEALTACDGVRQYLAQFGSGRHNDTAHAYLNQAEPKLTLLADHAAWNAVNSAQCARPTKAADCEAIQAYLSTYPSGAHAPEAKQALSAGSARLAALKQLDQARAEAADSVEELCTTLQQLDALGDFEKKQRRIDAQSGTVTLSERRETATARVLLEDQRDKLLRRITRAGVRFERARDCTEAE